MNLDFMFFLNSILLGIGLSMDAFSVSLANGLNEKTIRPKKMFLISGTFAFFQALMPLIGWFLVHSLLSVFETFSIFIPYITLALLGFIGAKMIVDSIKHQNEEEKTKVGFWGLIVQGIATSIDALSAGFTIAHYNLIMTLISILIIAIITFILSFIGINVGKRFGTKLSNKASIFGGIMLIAIGIEIFLTGIL